MNLAVGKGYFCDQSWDQPMPSITETRDRRLTARAGPSDGMVAVGTLVAERPPHRSRRALLTHRALPSDGGVEAVARHWVSYADRWEEAVGNANKAVPFEMRGLASPPQRLQPTPA